MYGRCLSLILMWDILRRILPQSCWSHHWWLLNDPLSRTFYLVPLSEPLSSFFVLETLDAIILLSPNFFEMRPHVSNIWFFLDILTWDVSFLEIVLLKVSTLEWDWWLSPIVWCSDSRVAFLWSVNIVWSSWICCAMVAKMPFSSVLAFRWRRFCWAATLRSCLAKVYERLLARMSRSCLVTSWFSRSEVKVSVLRAIDASMVLDFRGAIRKFRVEQ